MRVAAVQLEVAIADVAANLSECDLLVAEAAAAGAEAVALPEFFTTGASFDERLAGTAVAPDGAAAAFLSDAAARHGIWLGGSFLCRDADGEVRNAYMLAGPDGTILGRHDKDLPTMWENALYVGGHDDGLIETGQQAVGAAVCWEFMRSGTARRLRGRVDLVLGGSNWWTIPAWRPRAMFARMEAANAATARHAPSVFGRYVGAPVVHAAIAGPCRCPMPDMPGVMYDGKFQGGALIADATGAILASREGSEGSGIVVADVEARRVAPVDQVPDSCWLHPRGWLPAYAWHSQRVVGRRWYSRHVRGRPPLELDWQRPQPLPVRTVRPPDSSPHVTEVSGDAKNSMTKMKLGA